MKMQITRKFSAFLLVVLVFSMHYRVSGVATDEFSVYIGTTGYSSMEEAVTSLKDGDIIELRRDVVTSDAAIKISKSCTIDGHGHTITIYNTLIADGQDVEVTLNNLKFSLKEARIPNNSISAVAARGGSIVTLNNCMIPDLFRSAVSVHSSGTNNRIIVNSGYYSSKGYTFFAKYPIENTITINGGYFTCSSSAYSLFILQKTTVNINGGCFFSQADGNVHMTASDGVSAGSKLDTYNSMFYVFSDVSSGTETSLINIAGGDFYIADAERIITIRSGKALAKATAVSGNFYQTVSGYASESEIAEADKVSITGLNVQTLNDVEAAYEVLLPGGLSVKVKNMDENLNNFAVNGSVVVLMANTNATISCINQITLDKNEFTADGITCTNTKSSVRNGIVNANIYVQISADNTAPTLDARVLLALNSIEYKKAGIMFSLADNPTIGGTDVKNVEIYVLYQSIIADGEVVQANQLGGMYIQGAVLRNITSKNYGTIIYARPYVITNDGNVQYGKTISFSIDNIGK